jgi:hypothetical protein
VIADGGVALYLQFVRKLATVFAIFLAIVLNLSLAISTYSQVTGATLSGTVTDASGAAVPGASISAKNTTTGITVEATADANGFYNIPNLQPAPYEVRTTSKGFSTAVSNVTLAVGAQQTMNVALKIGETSQTVEVTESAPQINLTSSTLAGQVESQTVVDLPLNGRDWTSLATLHPGVKLIEEQMSYATSARGNRGFGAELTISGQRTTTNNYRLDGISVNDYANSGPGNVIGAALGVDAIQEFSVLTGGFPAEYGKAAGGVVNAITKSGTNAFHGDVYEFLRNSALDAREYFSRTSDTPLATVRRNQFGVAAGGPVIKDKTCVFGDYEGMRQTKGITTNIGVPSLAARQGILVGEPSVTPTAAALLDLQMFPLPTPGTENGNRGRFIFSGVQQVPENFYTVRLDHKLSANDSLSGTYLFDDTDFAQPDSFNNDILKSHTRRQTFVLQESHTFSANMLNAARVGYSRTHVIDLQPAGTTPGHTFASDPALGTGGQNAPEIQINNEGYTRMPGGVGVGSYYLHTFNNYQFYDDAFWTHGNHTIKFGGGVERMQYNFEAFQNQGGLWKFANMAAYLQNAPNHFEQGIPESLQPRELRQSLFAGYVQDDWRFRPNLTLNIGVRYEMTTTINDAQGRISSLLNISDPAPQCGKQYTAVVLPTLPGATCSSVGPYYNNPTKHNFEPRIGFAWDPFKDGKTSVRGGFGIYDVLPLPGYFLLQQNQAGPFTVFSSVNSNGAANGTNPLFGAFPTQGEPILVTQGGGKLAASTVEQNPHRNYVEEWNLNVQRQLTSSLSLTLGYVGSHGVHNLTRGDDGNMPLGVNTPAGLQFPCGPVAAGPDCNPGNNLAGANAQVNQTLGTIRYIYWATDSSYHALEANLDKKMAHGLQFQVAYTYGKSIDDSSSTIAGDTFEQGLNSLFWFAPKSLRGSSDYQVLHTVSVNTLWAIPTPKSWTGIAHTALGGWQMGGIVTYNSGIPTTAIIGGDPMGLNNGGADQFGIPNLISGCDPINHNFARNSSPTYINANCYVAPNIPASVAASLPYPCANFAGAPLLTNGNVYCANLLGDAGRNSITGPHLVNVDFSMVKNTPIKRISETFNVQFRAEIFNIFNHSNFLPPEPVSSSAGAQVLDTDGAITKNTGAIDSLATQPRDVQFALKVIW